MNLCRLTRHGHCQTLVAFVFEHVEAIHFWKAHYHAQGTAAWNNRGLINRITFRQCHPNQCVTSFVVGSHLFLFCRHNHAAALGPHHDLIFGRFKIIHRDETATDTCSSQCRLIHKVRQIRTREARGATRNDAQIYVGTKWRFTRMHAQNLFTPFDVRIANSHLTVKTTWTQQRRVQNIFAVCRRDNDNAFVGFKTIHLNQQLVQRLLTLIVATTVASATCTTNRIDLIDKHDARCVLFGLFKHVAHTRCTHANEHLNKVRTGNGEEWNTSLACNGTGQKRFTCTWRAL